MRQKANWRVSDGIFRFQCPLVSTAERPKLATETFNRQVQVFTVAGIGSDANMNLRTEGTDYTLQVQAAFEPDNSVPPVQVGTGLYNFVITWTGFDPTATIENSLWVKITGDNFDTQVIQVEHVPDIIPVNIVQINGAETRSNSAELHLKAMTIINSDGVALRCDGSSVGAVFAGQNSAGISATGISAPELDAIKADANHIRHNPDSYKADVGALAQEASVQSIITNPDTFKADVTGLAQEASVAALKALVDAIVAKLPAGTISDVSWGDVLDGRTVGDVIVVLQALASGNFAKTDAADGSFELAYKKHNSTDEAFAMRVANDGATRLRWPV